MGLVLFDANTNLSHHPSASHMSPPSDAVFILLPAIGCAPDVLISSPFMFGASSVVPTSLFQLCTCTSFAILPSLLVVNKTFINGPVHNSEDESIPNVKNKD